MGQFYAEKYLENIILLIPAIGYLQKGLIDDSEFLDANGAEIPIKNNFVVLHLNGKVFQKGQTIIDRVVLTEAEVQIINLRETSTLLLPFEDPLLVKPEKSKKVKAEDENEKTRFIAGFFIC